MPHKNKKPWFEHTTLYQIYPRSFYDTNADGIGDLNGITEKLDYLKGKPDSLGVDAIWLSPFYPSPMADFGYDVSNYCDVDPIFGTLKDFDRLIAEAHKRDIKVLLDFVPNHTSDHHPWFEASRTAKSNAKRDWYVWRSPKADGSPPNNWQSSFGGSAWQFDNNTNQYYLHSFLKEQPDLNWENPAVRSAMKKVMRFWLERGADGFRIDAVQFLGKDPQLRDDPPNPDYNPRKNVVYEELLHVHSKRSPALFTYLKEMTQVAKEYDNRLLIAEAYPHRRFEYAEYLSLYEKVDPAVLAPFNFEAIFLSWEAQAFKRYIDGYQARLQPGYMPVYAMGNHDAARIVTRFGRKIAPAAAVLTLSLPGIPVIYYGDELGMGDVRIPKEQAKDKLTEMTALHGSRDPQRTPMQWSSRRLAGFSQAAASWLPVGVHSRVNVASELAMDQSLLNLYRALLALRHDSEALQSGTYRPIECYYNDLFAFAREYGEEKIGVVINFSHTKQVDCPLHGELAISTHGAETNDAPLQPLEARIVRLGDLQD